MAAANIGTATVRERSASINGAYGFELRAVSEI